MTAPNDSEFIFEQRYRNNVWRVQLCTFGGNVRVSFWPWFKDADGALQPCNPKYIRNGLQMPPERLWALGEAITAAKAEIDSSGA